MTMKTAEVRLKVLELSDEDVNRTNSSNSRQNSEDCVIVTTDEVEVVRIL